MIINLPPVRDTARHFLAPGNGEGLSKQVFATWLKERPQAWWDGIEVIAMDGFFGFKSATAEQLSEATPVMDPSHVDRLTADALDECRHRVQQVKCEHRGRVGDPLYKARCALHTGEGLLTEKQQKRIADLCADEKHVEAEATWGAYQRMITAYRQNEQYERKKHLHKLIVSVKTMPRPG